MGQLPFTWTIIIRFYFPFSSVHIFLICLGRNRVNGRKVIRAFMFSTLFLCVFSLIIFFYFVLCHFIVGVAVDTFLLYSFVWSIFFLCLNDRIQFYSGQISFSICKVFLSMLFFSPVKVTSHGAIFHRVYSLKFISNTI